MTVPLLDLKTQYQALKSDIDAAVAEVLATQHCIMGPQVLELERQLGAYSQVPFAFGVSSGTDALLLPLMAENIGPGDEVITSAFSFFATAGSIARVGATPIFVDIDLATYNLDPAAVAQAITPRTKAIIPVHLYGQMAAMDELLLLARKHRLVVIEDAAQSLGAEDAAGRRAGSLGEYGCFSFYPTKNLGAVGDAGMVVTRDPERAERLKSLRVHGSRQRYYHELVGGNFRLDSIQAAVLLVKFRKLDAWIARRQAIAAEYARAFSGLSRIHLPAVLPGRHTFNQFVIRVAKRDELRQTLTAAKIGSEIYYPLPLPHQECFRHLGHKAGDFPLSEQAAAEVVALPIYPELTPDQQAEVIAAITAWAK